MPGQGSRPGWWNVRPLVDARVEPRGNAIVITKHVSDTAKIDPLMAAFNAIGWMSADPASSQPSISVV